MRARTTLLAMMGVLAALAPGFFASTAASPAQGETPTAGIEIVQTPSGTTGPCLPPALALRSSTSSDDTTFRLRITVTAPLCSRVNAVAAIYAMPGNGVAWPQRLVETKPFSLRQPGVTEVIFTKGCDPVQFDVITGATPPVIAPWGPWHGPLLFPFDPSTSLQFWGCGPPPSTTTTSSTSTTTTTTIADNCEDYTPSDLAVSPSIAGPGDTLSVTGSGRPGTQIQVLLRPPAAAEAALTIASLDAPTFVALSNPATVGPDGRWQTTVIIPSDAQAGLWTVAAQAVGCDTEVTSQVEISTGDIPSGSPSTEPPVVAGEVEVADLAAAAGEQAAPTVAGNSGTRGLAFTGTSVHLLIIAGIVLMCGGGLVLLSSRRRNV